MGKKANPAVEEDDLLAPKPAKKAKKEEAAPAKKARAKKSKKSVAKAEASPNGAAREALLKVGKKLKSYQDVADESGLPIRSIRRTARAMRGEGLLVIEKDGQACFVKKA